MFNNSGSVTNVSTRHHGEELDLGQIIDSESSQRQSTTTTTTARANNHGRLSKKLSFSHTNNTAMIAEEDQVDNHHHHHHGSSAAKSLKFRLRTSSFNKDGPVYSPVVETRDDQYDDDDDEFNNNKEQPSDKSHHHHHHNHTDLKTSLIRLLSNSSGKQKLSPSSHAAAATDGPPVAGSTTSRSNSIKIMHNNKKNSDETLDDEEKQELLFTFNSKKKSRTQSYDDDEIVGSDDGLDSWERDNDEEDEDDDDGRVSNKFKKKSALSHQHHKASPFSKSLDTKSPMIHHHHHVQSESSSKPSPSSPATPLSTSLKMTANNMILTKIDSASSTSSSSSGVGTDSSVSASKDEPAGIAAVGLIGGSVLYDKSNANVLIMEKGGKKRSDSIRMRHGSYHQCTDDDEDDEYGYGATGGRKLGKRQRLLRMLRNRRTKTTSKSQPVGQKAHISGQNYLIIFILFVVNLLNYIDRFTLAGVLSRIQKYFEINDSESGLLQTVFICSYMLLAPLFGYLGDRYSRKAIIIFGISFWSFMTFIGSFVPKEQFWLFVIIRSLVGIGEASYSCIAPTIIGDLFTSEARTKMLGIFYLAVPVGSGLGYIVGSNVANAFDDWKWALRVTPPLGFLCVVLLVFVVKEPKRGGADGGHHETSPSSFKEDVIYLLKNKTFIWITMGFTFASFVLGGLSWWVPIYVEYAILSNNQVPEQIPLLFGVVTCISGLFGVVSSSIMVSKLRRVTNQADPLVCALGSLIAVPTLFVLLVITRMANPVVFWLIAALAISAMCLSWTIVSDVLLYAIIPQRRSIASALNILITHLLGDAGSPYVIGAISDSLRSSKPDTYYNKFTSLQTALYAGPFFAALSFAAYLFAALYVDEDRKKVEMYIQKSKKESDTSIVAQQNPHLSSNNDSSNENSKIEEPTTTAASTQPSSKHTAGNLSDSTSTDLGSLNAVDQSTNHLGYANPLVVTAESEKTLSDSR